MRRQIIPLTALCLVGCVLAGCDFGILPVDPPVAYEVGQGLVEGEPGVVLGVFSEQLYEAFEPGDPAAVTRASQGGTWTHPALRTTGIGAKALVDCSITADDGERVGNSSSVEFFAYTGEGFLEIQAYPVRIAHTAQGKGPAIDDLFGTMATMRCRVVDDEDKSLVGEASVAVELTEG